MKQVITHRKERQDVTEFDAYVQTPAAGSLTLPSSGRFCLVATSAATAGVTALTITNDKTTTIAPVTNLDIGATIPVDHIPFDSLVTVAAGWDLLLDTGLGNYKKIVGGV